MPAVYNEIVIVYLNQTKWKMYSLNKKFPPIHKSNGIF